MLACRGGTHEQTQHKTFLPQDPVTWGESVYFAVAANSLTWKILVAHSDDQLQLLNRLSHAKFRKLSGSKRALSPEDHTKRTLCAMLFMSAVLFALGG